MNHTMKAFHTTSNLRWEALQKDVRADKGNREQLKNIQSAFEGENGAPTNTCWEFQTLVLQQLILTNPSLEVTSKLLGEPAHNAMGLKYALESLMAQQQWDVIWEQVFTDALAWRGVSMVTVEDNLMPRYMDGLEVLDWKGGKRTLKKGEEHETPRLVYIHPEDFFTDSEVRVQANSRRMGHKWQDSIERLKGLARDGADYDLSALDMVSGERDSDLIEVWQMYVPNYFDPEALEKYDGDEKPGEDDLHHGTLYTMVGGGGAGVDLRPPRVYRGPATGPYQVYECVPWPGKKDRYAPLNAVFNQIDQDARVGEALTDSSETYKRIVVATEQMAQALHDAENDGIATFGGAHDVLAQSKEEVEIGGPSEQLLKAYSLSREAVDRTLGISDTQRGLAQKGTTATAESIADKSSDIKISLYKTPLHRGVKMQCWVAGWHMEHSPSLVVPLPEEAKVKGLEMMRDSGIPVAEGAEKIDDGALMIYTGGDALKADSTFAYDAMMVEIVPLSMERTSEHVQQRRILQGFELTERALMLKANFPDFDAKGWLEEAGKRLNIPGMGKYAPGKGEAVTGPGEPGGQIPGEGMQGNRAGAAAAQGMA